MTGASFAGDDFAVARLIALCSPSLPIGAFAYSEGLEAAVAAGWITDAPSAQEWILGRLEFGLGCLELPLLARLYRAWADDDMSAVWALGARARAHRETRELREADEHLGQALVRLLQSLGVSRAERLRGRPEGGWLTAFALAASFWGVSLRATLVGFACGWLDGQCSAAVKLVPLGQTDGQRIILSAGARVHQVVDAALQVDDDDLGACSPGLSLCSAAHENQYTRLFRS